MVFDGFPTQSSTFERYYARRAIDGNANNVYPFASCSVTKAESVPWWMLTLKDLLVVVGVMITQLPKSKLLKLLPLCYLSLLKPFPLRFANIDIYRDSHQDSIN